MNNWFSQSADIINLIKRDNKNIKVIATNGVENPAIIKECDEWYFEGKGSSSTAEEYVEYALNFCKEHDINLFMPMRHMIDISEHRDEFWNIGVTLVVPSEHNNMRVFNSKVETFDVLKDVVPESICEYRYATNVEEFKKAVKELQDNGVTDICFKYTNDIACRSFRKLNMENDSIEMFSRDLAREMSYENAVKILGSVDSFPEMMVMQYLDGDEVSCDCFRMGNENIVVPRIKRNKRIQDILNDKEIIDVCNKILDYTNYDAPCNIQFKMVDGSKPMLLEINTRMSGGVQIASWATDINIPSLVVRRFTGDGELNWNKDWKDTRMTVRENYDKERI